MITVWRTPYLMAMIGIASSVTACTLGPSHTSPLSEPTVAPTAFTLVTPTPEPPELRQMRLATVEAAANEARISPGYVWTQTCERFRSTQSGCQNGR